MSNVLLPRAAARLCFGALLAAAIALPSSLAAQAPPYGQCQISLPGAPRAPVRIVGRVPLQPSPLELNVSRVDFNNDDRFDGAILDSAGAEVLLFLSTDQLAAGRCEGGATLTSIALQNAGTDPAADVTTLQLSTDGFMDLATVNNGGSVLIPNNNGQFQAQNITGNVFGGQTVAAADFDNDEREDLIIGTEDGVWVRYGVDATTLSNGSSVANIGADLLIVAQLNDDVLPDVLVVSDGAVFVIENAGGRLFASPRALGGPRLTNPVALAVGDFDENGVVDLAVVDGPGVELHVPPPTASPTISPTPSPTTTRPQEPTTTGPTPSEPTPTRTPTDTFTSTPTVTHTATRTAIMTPGLVHVFLQNTPAPVPSPISFVPFGAPLPAGRGPAAVSISDFDGDRHADIVVSSLSDDRLTFYYGNGTGSFTIEDPCAEDACVGDGAAILAGCCVGASPRSILVTTIDDRSTGARPDLLVANSDGQSISVLLSSNPPTHTPSNTPTTTNTPGPTNTASVTRTITRTPRNTERPTATCPPDQAICVQGESCAIAPAAPSIAMMWPWLGAAVLWLARRRLLRG